MDPHADLRDALEFADSGSAVKLSVDGARCREVAFSTRRWFCLVLWYGLRGVHVGEASNPSPIRQLSPGHGAL